MADAQSDYLTEKQLLLKRDSIFKDVENGHAQLVGQDGVGLHILIRSGCFVCSSIPVGPDVLVVSGRMHGGLGKRTFEITVSLF